MENMFKIAGVGIIGAVLALIVRKNSADFALLISIAVCCLIFGLVVNIIKPILTFVESLRETAGLNPAVLSPLIKAVGIGIITKIASSICADAKEGSIGSFIEMCGAILAIYVALPLMNTVLDLLSSYM